MRPGEKQSLRTDVESYENMNGREEKVVRIGSSLVGVVDFELIGIFSRLDCLFDCFQKVLNSF